MATEANLCNWFLVALSSLEQASALRQSEKMLPEPAMPQRRVAVFEADGDEDELRVNRRHGIKLPPDKCLLTTSTYY